MTAPGKSAQYAVEWLQDNGVMTWRRVYPGRLDQVPQARSWSAMLLADTDCADDAALIVTELCSNALLHTRSGEPKGWFGVEITRGRQARIAVHDLGGRPAPPMAVTTSPQPGEEQDALAEHGHGLQAVRELAIQIGVSGSPDSGHTVWALLTMDRPPARSERPIARL
ncbi:ATP-binding protein [Actinomadura darangshiensis]|nr:ATP-binding protein [Actinomadura darangshiensis]